MFHTPAHKQLDQSKLPAQRVNPVGGVTAREAHRAAHLEKLDAACARPLGPVNETTQQAADRLAVERAARAKGFDMVGQIIAHEAGELDEEATVELFQHLIDTGTVWSLQGAYGRVATQLIQMGVCTRKSASGLPLDASGAVRAD